MGKKVEREGEGEMRERERQFLERMNVCVCATKASVLKVHTLSGYNSVAYRGTITPVNMSIPPHTYTHTHVPQQVWITLGYT